MNEIIAAILSFIIPGLGQALSGDLKRGIMFFIGAAIIGLIVWIIFKNWLATIINLVYALYAAYDAYQMASYV